MEIGSEDCGMWPTAIAGRERTRESGDPGPTRKPPTSVTCPGFINTKLEPQSSVRTLHLKTFLFHGHCKSYMTLRFFPSYISSLEHI